MPNFHMPRLQFPKASDWPAAASPARPQTVDQWLAWQDQVNGQISETQRNQIILARWAPRLSPFILTGFLTIYANAENLNGNGLCTGLALIASAYALRPINKFVVAPLVQKIQGKAGAMYNRVKTQADGYRTAGLKVVP